ncbi:MAG: UvrD-helicase domain-containing protein [Gammaproteobacteria bacterium]|nr:UvrD-helicase domain-containing protein [Gammaproteobacteria bacterium]
MSQAPILAPDHQARERILDPEQSFIVQAPAGSGKTELLTQRYLLLLAHADKAPEEIIAITFTRKAAAEMRARVLASLQRATDATPPKDNHAQKTWALARAALAKDGEQNWNILNNSQRLKITTIDSLCANLVQKMPIVSSLGSPPQVEEDLSLLYQEAVHALLKDWGQLPEWHNEFSQLLRHLDNQLGWFENLMVEMLRRREQWLDVVTLASQQHQLREILEYSLQAAALQMLHNLNKAFPIELESELLVLLQFAIQERRIGNVTYLNLNAMATLEALDTWRSVAEILLTSTGEWRKVVNVKQGFPAGESKQEKSEYKAIKDRIHVLLQALRDPESTNAKRYESFRSALVSLSNVKAVVYQDKQWQIVQALLVILPIAVERLKQLFAKEAVVDFNEISLAALQALGNEGEPTELALSLDYRIRHLLIDEFQDTSQLQFQLLQALTRGWEPGDGRSLFLVGDPMQSIYRFRQADVSLFLQAKNYGVGNLLLEYVQLTANFRSDIAVIDWVNRQFVDIFPLQDDMVNGAVSYRSSISTRKYQGSEVAFIPTATPQDEAAQVVQKIQSLLMQAPEDNIAILARSRSHLQAIIPALQQAGIHYQAVDIESISERQVIRDLLSLTYALSHLGDRLSWMAVLRAPWCGLSLPDLTLIAKVSAGVPIWQALQDPDLCHSLSEPAQQSLTRIIPILAASILQRDRFSLRQWVELTWWNLGGVQCLTDPVDIDNAESYFAMVENISADGRLPERERIEQFLERLKAQTTPVSKAPVQIMTVHKAKGLEFDTVIIPGLGKGERPDSASLLLWESYPLPDGGHGLLMAPIKSRDMSDEPIYDFIKETNQARKRYESQRQLYVAVTRAKKRLYLMGSANYSESQKAYLPKSGSFLALLWPSLKNTVSAAAFQSESTTNIPFTKPSHAQLARLVCHPLGYDSRLRGNDTISGGKDDTLRDGNEIVLEADNFSSRAIGTLVHRYLAEMAVQGLEVWTVDRLEGLLPKWHDELKLVGVVEKECESAAKRVQLALNRILEDEQGRWILGKHVSAQVELALIYQSGLSCKKYIIDRTFIDKEDKRWIIDYKTSEPKPGQDLQDFLQEQKSVYQDQLETYGKILQDNKVQHLGLYFPLLPYLLTWQSN